MGQRKRKQPQYRSRQGQNTANSRQENPGQIPSPARQCIQTDAQPIQQDQHHLQRISPSCIGIENQSGVKCGKGHRRQRRHAGAEEHSCQKPRQANRRNPRQKRGQPEHYRRRTEKTGAPFDEQTVQRMIVRRCKIRKDLMQGSAGIMLKGPDLIIFQSRRECGKTNQNTQQEHDSRRDIKSAVLYTESPPHQSTIPILSAGGEEMPLSVSDRFYFI